MRKAILIGGGIIAILIAGALIASRIGSTPTEPTPSPSPSISATITPTVKTLRTYFGAPQSTVTVTDSTTIKSDFRASTQTAQPAAKQAVSIAVQKNGVAVPAGEFLAAVLQGTPSGLISALSSDWMALAFGQTEMFDASGASVPGAAVSSRTVLIFELSDASAANQSLTTWQTSGLAQSGQDIFGYDVSRALVPSFSTGTYRQISVYYQNFPYADRSIDYAIALASNGKNYLILSGSRESIFFAIDQLMQ